MRTRTSNLSDSCFATRPVRGGARGARRGRSRSPVEDRRTRGRAVRPQRDDLRADDDSAAGTRRVAIFDELPEEQLRANSNFVSRAQRRPRDLPPSWPDRSGRVCSSSRGSTTSRVKTSSASCHPRSGRRQRSCTRRAGSAKPSTPARSTPAGISDVRPGREAGPRLGASSRRWPSASAFARTSC